MSFKLELNATEMLLISITTPKQKDICRCRSVLALDLFDCLQIWIQWDLRVTELTYTIPSFVGHPQFLLPASFLGLLRRVRFIADIEQNR